MFLIVTEASFIQEVSGVYTSPFLDGMETKPIASLPLLPLFAALATFVAIDNVSSLV